MARMRRRDYVQESMELNSKTYDYYYSMLTEIAANSIIIDGLPDEINRRYISLGLVTKGNLLFFQDEIVNQYLMLEYVPESTFNIYGEPTKFLAFAANGYRAFRTIQNAVPIHNSYLHRPMIADIEMFARSMSNIKRSIDVNSGNQKFPFILQAIESQRLSVENAFMQIDGNCPVILTDPGMAENAINAIDVNIPFVSDKLHIELHQIFNDFLTWCGVENSNQDKRERLVADEVGSNFGAVEVNRYTRINSLQECFDQVNRMFGLDIQVRHNSNLLSQVNKASLLGFDELYLSSQRDRLSLPNKPQNEQSDKGGDNDG